MADTAVGQPAQISAGQLHSCAVSAEGGLWCWGRNSDGQLGDGTTTNRIVPTPVPLSSVAQVSAGYGHSCAVTTGGAVRCWGQNDFGQLGDGTTTNRLTPTLVSGLTDVTQVSVGPSHSCAVTTGGAVRCWGRNVDGRLGDGTTTGRLTPTLVSGLPSSTMVSAGFNHTCAVTSSGGGFCWGLNDAGQLGDGTTTTRTTATAVSSLSGVTQVTAGTNFSCARVSGGGGQARCWGDNTWGQLGDGSVLPRTTPNSVVGLTGAATVTAGSGYACATRANGEIHCWGDNGLGQLGDGTIGGVKSVPSPVVGLSAGSQVDAGSLHACAVSATFQAHCWGANGQGQLGDGVSVIARSTPQRVLIFTAPVLIAPVAGHTFTAGDTQTFTVRAPNPDVAYWAKVTVRDAVTSNEVVTIDSAPALAGDDAVSIAIPGLPEGGYTWEAQWSELDESVAYSVASAPRGFTVVAEAGSDPPDMPTQVAPEAGKVFGSGEPQTFTITTTDPGGNDYTGTIEIYASGVLVRALTTPSAASGSDAAATASPALTDGAYTWRARACRSGDATLCSGWTTHRSFAVDTAGAGPPDNDPPTVEVLYPVEGFVFDAGQRQDFTIRATDPDGDPYDGRIQFRDLNDVLRPEVVNTHLAPSGVPSSGTLYPGGLPPGTWIMEVMARDLHGGVGGTSQMFGVASAEVSPCAASVPSVDGWFGDRYLQVASAVVDDIGYVCLRTAESGTDAGKLSGWLRGQIGEGPSGGGAPTVGTGEACEDGGDDNLPFPLLSLGAGGTPSNPTNQLWGALKRTGSSVTACFKVKAAGGEVASHSVTIAAPEGAQLSDVNFVPQPQGAWSPPVPFAPPAGLPSSECHEATTGGTLLVNAQVGSERLFVYTQSAGDTTRVCVRAQSVSDGSGGGIVVRATTDPGPPPYELFSGRAKDDPATPCRTDDYLLFSDAPVSTRLHATHLDAEWVGVCVYVGTNTSPPTFVAADVLVSADPDPSLISHDLDP